MLLKSFFHHLPSLPRLLTAAPCWHELELTCYLALLIANLRPSATGVLLGGSADEFDCILVSEHVSSAAAREALLDESIGRNVGAGSLCLAGERSAAFASLPTFKKLLEFIYSDQLVKIENVDQAIDVLVAANKYGLDRLKRLCEKYLVSIIELDNVIDLLYLSDMH